MLPENPIDRWRLLPLNQLAALKLKEAGESVSEHSLPVFQLMIWGLAKGLKPSHRRTAQELLRLQYRNPTEAFAALAGGAPEELAALQGQLLNLPPKVAAEKLLEVLDRRLRTDPRQPLRSVEIPPQD